jgi:hypothetical protein
MDSVERTGGGARSALMAVVVTVVGFFDGVFVGAPTAIAAAVFRPLPVYCVAVLVVVLVVIGCCRWLDRRWAEWFAGKGRRVETRLAAMRASRLMRHPVGWIERGSDRWYAVAAAVANPILVAAFARVGSGKPVGDRRIVLGAVAYAFPYVAMWTLVGLALSVV